MSVSEGAETSRPADTPTAGTAGTPHPADGDRVAEASRSVRPRTTERRAARSREIVAATRALFDERGVREAQIEDIARAVGINRAIIYRHFSSKEELFAVTLLGYLAELDDFIVLSFDELAEPTGTKSVIQSNTYRFSDELTSTKSDIKSNICW